MVGLPESVRAGLFDLDGVLLSHGADVVVKDLAELLERP